MKSADAASALKVFRRTFDRAPSEIRKNMTYDRGKEMTDHKDPWRIEKELDERPGKVHGFYTTGEMYRSILTGKPVALGR
jgi:IS30 family transposase